MWRRTEIEVNLRITYRDIHNQILFGIEEKEKEKRRLLDKILVDKLTEKEGRVFKVPMLPFMNIQEVYNIYFGVFSSQRKWIQETIIFSQPHSSVPGLCIVVFKWAACVEFQIRRNKEILGTIYND